MSDAIRCKLCRWWLELDDGDGKGACEFSPPVFIGGDPWESDNWHQPLTMSHEGCSRGERKASNLTVSDGDPVAMVDGLPVFRAKLTEDAT